MPIRLFFMACPAVLPAILAFSTFGNGWEVDPQGTVALIVLMTMGLGLFAFLVPLSIYRHGGRTNGAFQKAETALLVTALGLMMIVVIPFLASVMR